MPNARFVAERQDDSVYLERISGDVPRAESGSMRIVIAGHGSDEDLARIAARCHFAMNPERKKAFIFALGTTSP